MSEADQEQFVVSTREPVDETAPLEDSAAETDTGMGSDPGAGSIMGDPGDSGQPGLREDVEMTVEDVSGLNPDDFNPDEGALVDYDPTLDLPKFQSPPLSLLADYDQGDTTVTNEELISNKNRIVETLGNYNIKIDKIKATIGPTVTLYEIVPAPGIRISKIKSLEDGQKIIRDLADKALIEIYMWSVHRFHREHEPPAAG